MANQIEVEIVARLDGIESSLKKLQTDAKAAGDNIGKSLGSNVEKGITSSFKSIAATVAAVGATILSSIAFKKIIDEASKSEDAINSLNQALASAGTFSQEASLSIQAFADEIQRTTTLDDEAVISGVALARTFARTNEEAVKLTKAAIDLAAAKGVTLDTAVEQLGKTLTGTAGRLANTVSETKNLTEAQLKAGAAIDVVANRFAGSGAAQLNTFSGAITHLNNIFDNFLETIGKFVIQSPAIKAVIGFISDTFIKLADSIAKLNKSGEDPFKNLLINAIDVARFFVGVLGPVVEFTMGLFNKLGIIVGGLAGVFLALLYPTSQSAITLGQVFEEVTKSSEDFQLKGTAAIDGFLTGMKKSVEDAKAVNNDYKNNVVGNNAAIVADTLTSVNLFQIAYRSMAMQVKITTEEMNAALRQLKQNLFQTFVTGLQSAFSSIGAALVNGENVFAAFGKGVLRLFGDIALQLGQFYLLLGIASIWINPPAAAGMIAAGIALSILGGALQALAGGGGGGPKATPATAGGNNGGGVTTGTASPIGDSATSFAQNEERQAPGSNVTVNIAGSVLGDKRTLGKEIADSLNEAFGFDGIVISRGALS